MERKETTEIILPWPIVKSAFNLPVSEYHYLFQDGKPVIVSSYDNVTYFGQYEPTKTCKTYLAIQDKKRRTIELVDAAIFTMIPKVQNLSTSNLVDMPDNDVKDFEETALTFGSKNLIKAISHRNKFNTSKDLMENHYRKIANEIVNISDNEDVELMQTSSILPSCNFEAETLDEVYDISEIVNESDLAELKHPVKIVCRLDSNQWIDAKTKHSPLFINIFEELKKLKQKKLISKILMRTKITYALYLDCLFILANLNSVFTLESMHSVYPDYIPDSILNSMINKFTDQDYRGLRKRTPEMFDKLVCHAIIVTFLCLNYKFPMFLFLNCFPKLTETKFRTILHLLGGYVSKSDSIATVTVPLKPLLKVPKRKHYRR